jgi:protein phosphatase
MLLFRPQKQRRERIMKFQAAVSCHVGHIRKNNEDNFFLNGAVRRDTDTLITARTAKGQTQKALFAVADGMGGGANGEIASAVTVSCLRPAAASEVPSVSSASIAEANSRICDHIRNTNCGSMGSTLVALYLDRDTALGCNVGDSRLYLYRAQYLRLLSTDHTSAQMLVDMGVLTPEQARNHPGGRALRQHIGIFEEDFTISPAYTAPISLQPGDIFLLCSDGLTDMLTDQQIGQVLRSDRSAEELAQTLTQQALDHGGKDNVTALVVKIHDKKWFDCFKPGKR